LTEIKLNFKEKYISEYENRRNVWVYFFNQIGLALIRRWDHSGADLSSALPSPSLVTGNQYYLFNVSGLILSQRIFGLRHWASAILPMTYPNPRLGSGLNSELNVGS
jgi:hypothetical protein